MSDDFTLEEWVAGFFDGEGYVGVTPSPQESYKIGYSTEVKVQMAQTSPSYVGGLFDAEGNINLRVWERDSSAIGCTTTPESGVEMNGELVVETMNALAKYCEDVGANYNVYGLPKKGEENNGVQFWVTTLDGTKKFLENIEPHLIEKRAQAKIMISEIIPRMEDGDHLRKEGFLEIMAWRDLMDSFKGGRRGKYNLAYFEDLWDMELPEEKKPDINDIKE